MKCCFNENYKSYFLEQLYFFWNRKISITLYEVIFFNKIQNIKKKSSGLKTKAFIIIDMYLFNIFFLNAHFN